MAKTHVSLSGQVVTCGADKRACPRGSSAPHFDSLSEGQAWLEQMSKEKNIYNKQAGVFGAENLTPELLTALGVTEWGRYLADPERYPNPITGKVGAVSEDEAAAAEESGEVTPQEDSKSEKPKRKPRKKKEEEPQEKVEEPAVEEVKAQEPTPEPEPAPEPAPEPKPAPESTPEPEPTPEPTKESEPTKAKVEEKQEAKEPPKEEEEPQKPKFTVYREPTARERSIEDLKAHGYDEDFIYRHKQEEYLEGAIEKLKAGKAPSKLEKRAIKDVATAITVTQEYFGGSTKSFEERMNIATMQVMNYKQGGQEGTDQIIARAFDASERGQDFSACLNKVYPVFYEREMEQAMQDFPELKNVPEGERAKYAFAEYANIVGKEAYESSTKRALDPPMLPEYDYFNHVIKGEVGKAKEPKGVSNEDTQAYIEGSNQRWKDALKKPGTYIMLGHSDTEVYRVAKKGEYGAGRWIVNSRNQVVAEIDVYGDIAQRGLGKVDFTNGARIFKSADELKKYASVAATSFDKGAPYSTDAGTLSRYETSGNKGFQRAKKLLYMQEKYNTEVGKRNEMRQAFTAHTINDDPEDVFNKLSKFGLKAPEGYNGLNPSILVGHNTAFVRKQINDGKLAYNPETKELYVPAGKKPLEKMKVYTDLPTATGVKNVMEATSIANAATRAFMRNETRDTALSRASSYLNDRHNPASHRRANWGYEGLPPVKPSGGATGQVVYKATPDSNMKHEAWVIVDANKKLMVKIPQDAGVISRNQTKDPSQVDMPVSEYALTAIQNRYAVKDNSLEFATLDDVTADGEELRLW